ncbi:MAG: glycosyl transferase, family 2 [Actinomycetia bacterium]|nr:glycosyl transferase, family 2 [Actinomycetes bacterium]
MAVAPQPSSAPDGPGDQPGYICFAAVDWWYHNRAHSELQLMTRLARTRKVLLVNSIGMRMPLPGRSTKFMFRIWRKLKSTLKLVKHPIPDTPNFAVLSPLILPFYSTPWARKLNAVLVRGQVRAAQRWLGIRDPIIVVTIPTAWEVVKPMRRRALIFNRIDKHSSFDEADEGYIAAMEHQLLAHSDVTLFVSKALLDEEMPETDGHGVFFDHGVDVERFDAAATLAEPEDLRAIPHPRIGFFGGLDDYVIDFDLLERLARDIPDAQLVLVGEATCSMERFDRYTNVHWLGYKPYAEIPRYGAGFDVGILPRLDSKWSKYTNPIKLKEYLALGIPVVTRDLPEAHRYAEWIRIAGDDDAFVAATAAALADGGPGTPSERKRVVAGDTWDARTDELIERCENAGNLSGLRPRGTA